MQSGELALSVSAYDSMPLRGCLQLPVNVCAYAQHGPGNYHALKSFCADVQLLQQQKIVLSTRPNKDRLSVGCTSQSYL